MATVAAKRKRTTSKQTFNRLANALEQILQGDSPQMTIQRRYVDLQGDSPQMTIQRCYVDLQGDSPQMTIQRRYVEGYMERSSGYTR